MSDDYVLKFDLSFFEALEVFARQANHRDNLGDKGDWLNHFLWGLNGLRARMLGVELNYPVVHSWKLTRVIALSGIPWPQLELHFYDVVEYYLSTILFNMDSAIECMVFMLNALGYAKDKNQFKDVVSEKELKGILFLVNT